MNERRRLLKEYIRNDADEELDYLTIIPYSDGEPYVSRIAFNQAYWVKTSDGQEYFSHLWYSIDGGEWIQYIGGYIDVPCFSKIRFKGDWHDVMKDVEYNDDIVFEWFYIPYLYSESGNDWWLLEGTPLSLIHGDNFKEQKNDWNNGWNVFWQLFYENQNIGQINNPKTFLPSTELSPWCCREMFAFSSIVNAPELPAETLKEGCYYAMFGECNSLEEAPALNAKMLEQYCYGAMFYGCEKLHYAKMTAVGFSDNVTEDPTFGMFEGCGDYGLVVLSQEMIDMGFASYHLPNWSVITEDYPTNEQGYPETTGTIYDYDVLCFNIEFNERNTDTGDIANYFLSGSNELRKELYEALISWMDKDTFYDAMPIFVNRNYFTKMVWKEDYGFDAVLIEHIEFKNVSETTYYDSWLHPDGTLDLVKQERLIYDYIK